MRFCQLPIAHRRLTVSSRKHQPDTRKRLPEYCSDRRAMRSLSGSASVVMSRMAAEMAAIFITRSRWNDVPLTVTQVRVITKPAADHRGFVASAQAAIDITLLHGSKCGTDVFEFLIHGMRNFTQPDDQ